MEITRAEQFFECTCGCSAVSVVLYAFGEPTEVGFQLWEARGTRLTWAHRIKTAWKCLWGRGVSEEIVLSPDMALLLAQHLNQLAPSNKMPPV